MLRIEKTSKIWTYIAKMQNKQFYDKYLIVNYCMLIVILLVKIKISLQF